MRDERNRRHNPKSKKNRVNTSDNQKVRDLQAKRKQVKRARNKVRLIYLLIFLIAALICPSLIRKVLGKSPDTFVLKTGTIEQSFNSKAIIFRNEKLLESSIEGSCIPHYEDGEKVANDRVIATIVNSASQEQLEEIRKLDMRILQAKEEASKHEEFFKGDIEKIDSEIEKIARKIAQTSVTGNIIKCKQYETSINNLLQKKADILNFAGDKNAFLKQLEKQKEDLAESIKGNIEELKNTESGVVSYTIDGYEKEFSLSYMYELDCQSFEENLKRLESDKINKNASFNRVYAKITDDLYYYVACMAELSEINDLKNGSAVTVRINDNNLYVNMIVESIRKEDGKAIVILKSSKALGETMSLRLIDIDVISKKIDGLKVPIKTLVNYNNLSKTAEVACIKYSYVRFIPVKVVGMDKDYAIIENDEHKAHEQGYIINYNDMIITNPDKFVEGQLVY